MIRDIEAAGFGRILKFIIPTYLTALFTTMYTIVDGVFVSRYVGTDALAAINVVYPVVNILTGIALVFAVGGSSWAAIYLGRREKDTVNGIFMFCIAAELIAGIVVSGVILFFLPGVLGFLGATEQLLGYCDIYIKIWLFGFPVVMLKELFVYFIRADGNPGFSFIVSASGGILNIILDYIFVGRWSWGIFGAGIATLLGLGLSCVIGILYIIKFSRYLKFSRTFAGIRFLPGCVLNGASEMVNQMAIAVTTVVFNRSALTFAGEDGVAAVSIIMYVQFVFLGIYTGYSMGISPLLGYAYGQQNKMGCKKLEKYSYRFFSTIPPVLYVAAFICAPFAVSCFAVRGSGVYELGVRGMRIYSLGYFFAGISIFAAARFTAYGQGKYSAVITAMRSFFLLLLFLLVMPELFGMDGVWMAVPAAETVTVVVTLSLLRWKKMKFLREM